MHTVQGFDHLCIIRVLYFAEDPCAADGQLSGVQVLIATSCMGVVQAIIGGQPMLIVGVAEPIVLIYGFMFTFAKGACRGHASLCSNGVMLWQG